MHRDQGATSAVGWLRTSCMTGFHHWKGWNNTSPAGSSRRQWLSHGQCPARQHDVHSNWRQHDHNWQTQNPGFLSAALGGPRMPRVPTGERSR